jgi:hypothetical protein
VSSHVIKEIIKEQNYKTSPELSGSVYIVMSYMISVKDIQVLYVDNFLSFT